MKVTAIIQARMTSTRLPGKVLLTVMEQPLIKYQIERLRNCKKINRIIIATTEKQTDDPIELFARSEGIDLYRGSEDDVLDRYYRTAKYYNIHDIMRITADCPLIDPDICDLISRKYFESGVDYIQTGASFAEGLDCEIFSFNTLKQAWKNARARSEREHVTLYMRNHPDIFRMLILENDQDDSRYRITVDEESDFLVVKEILENLYKEKNRCFRFQEIKSFLNANPNIYRLNADIIRNEGLLRSLSETESL